MNLPTYTVNPALSSTRASLVDCLARVILMHEGLTPDELPRCRREVMLQLRVSRTRAATRMGFSPRNRPSTSSVR